MEEAVKAKFDSWGSKTRKAGLKVRELILDQADSLSGVGAIHETLKWNQPAYLTPATGSGSTIRIDEVKANGQLGLYFHCQTSLVETFRSHYNDTLQFEKNRAIIINPEKPLPLEALGHCIGLALTYHLKKKIGKL